VSVLVVVGKFNTAVVLPIVFEVNAPGAVGLAVSIAKAVEVVNADA
jgi:hypothetical protein